MAFWRAYVGLGANQGDLENTLESAIEAIGSIERSALVAVSPFYMSAPIDADGPDFLNAVASIDTELEPYGLLLHLLDIELMLGRKRRSPGGERKPARKVDLDLLLLGDLIIRSTPLTLPHPRLHQRAFVLRPLLDLAPELHLPGIGPARDCLARVADQRVEYVRSTSKGAARPRNAAAT
jgi:2-amino-4-hydroxy-6-hydroxymethyldihydropteridine diphosphokinase